MSETSKKVWGYAWRSSYWFVTFVVFLGVLTDLLVYSIIVPVIPFQLEILGYDHISTLTGWLLFAYSAALALSTIAVAMVAEKYYTKRQLPLIIGNVVLIGSQIMFMEAPTYWVMCLARALQGIGSTMVWVIGLALICDVTPKKFIGRQLGVAMSGFTIGILLGPPVGGALYERFGFRGPFILGIIFAFVDLVGRLFIIEVKPQAEADTLTPTDEEREKSEPEPDNSPDNTQPLAEVNLTFAQVIMALARSSRACTAALISLVFGIVAAMQDTVISLHLNAVWELKSGKVGLVVLAAVVPTIFAPLVSGWLSDRVGTSWITFFGIVLTIPWHGVLIIEGPLALFIAAFAISNFFLSTIVTPVTAELAAVARDIDGVGYAHVYSVFNFAFGIGSVVGPIIGGQIYDHVRRGWMVLCILLMGCLVICGLTAIFYTGDPAVVSQIIGWKKRKRTDKGSEASAQPIS